MCRRGWRGRTWRNWRSAIGWFGVFVCPIDQAADGAVGAAAPGGGAFRTAARFAEQHGANLRAGNALHLAICAEYGAALCKLYQRLPVAECLFLRSIISKTGFKESFNCIERLFCFLPISNQFQFGPQDCAEHHHTHYRACRHDFIVV